MYTIKRSQSLAEINTGRCDGCLLVSVIPSRNTVSRARLTASSSDNPTASALYNADENASAASLRTAPCTPMVAGSPCAISGRMKFQ